VPHRDACAATAAFTAAPICLATTPRRFLRARDGAAVFWRDNAVDAGEPDGDRIERLLETPEVRNTWSAGFAGRAPGAPVLAWSGASEVDGRARRATIACSSSTSKRSGYCAGSLTPIVARRGNRRAHHGV